MIILVAQAVIEYFLSTLSGQKYFNITKYPCINCAINQLSIFSWEPKWELKYTGIKVCCVRINYGENFRYFAFREVLIIYNIMS